MDWRKRNSRVNKLTEKHILAGYEVYYDNWAAYTEIMTLANDDITRIDTVLKMPFNEVQTYLAHLSWRTWVERQYMEQK